MQTYKELKLLANKGNRQAAIDLYFRSMPNLNDFDGLVSIQEIEQNLSKKTIKEILKEVEFFEFTSNWD